MRQPAPACGQVLELLLLEHLLDGAQAIGPLRMAGRRQVIEAGRWVTYRVDMRETYWIARLAERGREPGPFGYEVGRNRFIAPLGETRPSGNADGAIKRLRPYARRLERSRVKPGARSSERRIGPGDAVGAFDHGALEAARLDRDMLGEEPGDGDARSRIRRLPRPAAASPPAPPPPRACRPPRWRTAADRAWRRRGLRPCCGRACSHWVARSRLWTASPSRVPVQPKAGSLAASTVARMRRSSPR